MLEVRHFAGLDLGQVNDFTALVVLRQEREVQELPKPRAARHWHELEEAMVPPPKPGPARYICIGAERFQRGTSYTVLAEKVGQMFRDPKFAGQPLIVDGTGVGRPVVDIFRKARINCRLVPVTITGGAAALTIGQVKIDEFGYWHVPKKELVGSVQAMLGTGSLSYRKGLPLGPMLSAELKNFTYKINPQTAHTSYEAWREADKDDAVLALSLAAWYAQRAQQQLWVM